MKRLLATTLLSLVCCAANAEWAHFTTTANMAVYTEPTKKQQSGNFVKAWYLFDYKTPQKYANKVYMSLNAQYQFNCLEKVGRLVYVAYFKDNKVNYGDAPVHISNTPNEEWSPPVPDSLVEALAEWACTK